MYVSGGRLNRRTLEPVVMRQLQCRVVEDGYFVPGGLVSRQDLVYDANRALVVESTLWRKQTSGWVNHLASEAPPVLPRHRFEPRTEHTLLFLGPYRTPRYGHWITEGLPADRPRL